MSFESQKTQPGQSGPSASNARPVQARGAELGSQLRGMSYAEGEALLQPAGPAVQRYSDDPYEEFDGDSDHVEDPDASLSNARFTKYSKLKKIRRGKHIIKSSDSESGKHVKAVQKALVDMGFDLVFYDADAGWGSETSGAVRQFQETTHLTENGDLNSATMGELDKQAPPKKEEVKRYADYDELLKDGILDFTIGLGFDENGIILDELEELIPRVAPELGLDQVDEGTVAEMYAEKGQTAPKYGASHFWAKRDRITAGDKSGHVVVRVFAARNNANAAKDYTKALQNSDVTLYGGHGRYGSGPDFDRNYLIEKKSGDEWKEISKKKLKKMIGGDLDKLQPLIDQGKIRIILTNEGNIQLNDENRLKDFGSKFQYWVLQQGDETKRPTESEDTDFEKKYKVWFFNGCTTNMYMPSVRAQGVSTENTDMVGTGDKIGKLVDGLIIQMKGIIEKQPIQQIVKELNKSYDMKAGKKGWRTSGMGDNPTTAG